MSPITIDHHRSADAACCGCEAAWHAGGAVSILAVLCAAAEHALETGHTVTEHVTDDAVICPLEPTMNARERR